MVFRRILVVLFSKLGMLEEGWLLLTLGRREVSVVAPLCRRPASLQSAVLYSQSLTSARMNFYPYLCPYLSFNGYISFSISLLSFNHPSLLVDLVFFRFLLFSFSLFLSGFLFIKIVLTVFQIYQNLFSSSKPILRTV